MKKVLKIFLWFILMVFMLIIILTVVAKLSENKIADIATNKVTEIIQAPVKIGDVSFNLLRKFPHATIELNDIYLGSTADSLGNDSLVYLGDTIVNIGKIYLAVKTKPLLDGIVEIVKVELENATAFYLVNSKGQTNIDFLIPPSDSTQIEEHDTAATAPINATLKKLTLNNIHLIYMDSSMQMQAKVWIPEINMGGFIHGDTIAADATGNLEIFDVIYPETNAYKMQRTRLAFNVLYNRDTVSVKNITLLTDGIKLALSGKAAMGDEIFTDLNIDMQDVDFGELIKYAPEEMLQEFGIEKVAGHLKLSARVKGKYSETQMPKIDAKIAFNQGNVRTKDYPELKNIAIVGKVSNGVLRNNETTQADFEKFYFETPNSTFNTAFSVLDIDHPKYNLTSNFNVNIADFKDLVPKDLVKKINGKVQINFATKGVFQDSVSDAFIQDALAQTTLNVKIRDFDVLMDSVPEVKHFAVNFNYKPNHISASHLKVSVPDYGVNIKNGGLAVDYAGSVFNTSSLKIKLRNYFVETDSSKISGYINLDNPDHPTFKIFTKAQVNFNEFAHLVPDTLLSKFGGLLNAQIKTQGNIDLDSIESQVTDIVFKNSAFKFSFKNIDVEIPDDPLAKIENCKGVIDMDPTGIRINDLSLTAAGIYFAIDSTTIDNVYETIMKASRDTQIVVQTNIHMGTIDYNILAPMFETDSTLDATDEIIAESQPVTETSDTVVEALLPNFEELGIPHFLVHGKVAIDKIVYEKNILDNISLKFRFADSLYVVDQFKLKTCGGETNSSFKLEARGKYWDDPIIDLKNTINHLDLEELLIRNHKYAEPAGITHENLSGLLTSEMHARIFYKDLIVNESTAKIRAKGHFTLEKGRLYNFQPLVDASVGIGGLKELDKMDFNTLNTSIFMFKDKVYIPKTDVVSNALDLSAFAMHGIDSTLGYEYHLVLHLGDVLTGKSDKLMAEQAKQNKKDGTTADRKGLNLVSLKLPDKSKSGFNKKNGFDNDKLKDDFMKGLKRQQAFLNLLFDPRLVNFSTALDRSEFIESQTGNQQ